MVVVRMLVVAMVAVVVAAHVVADEASNGRAEKTANRVHPAEDGADETTGERTRQHSPIGSEDSSAAVSKIAAPAAVSDLRAKADAG